MVKLYLIIIAICIVPPIINMIFLYITVKYNIWNWISRCLYSDEYVNYDKVDEDSVKRALIPIVSAVILFETIILYIGAIVYYIVKYTIMIPFGKIINFFSNGIMKGFNRIEDKREFYENLNSNHWR